jgi:coenzyme PQQ precursor peptide PqqA
MRDAACGADRRPGPENGMAFTEEPLMSWTTPTIEEICVGMEINSYFPAEL